MFKKKTKTKIHTPPTSLVLSAKGVEQGSLKDRKLLNNVLVILGKKCGSNPPTLSNIKGEENLDFHPIDAQGLWLDGLREGQAQSLDIPLYPA